MTTVSKSESSDVAVPKRWSELRSSMAASLSSPLFLASFIAGGMAGAVSRTVVSPFERMKIIFQVQLKSDAGGQLKHYNGMWDTLVKIWREEGFQGYMRGNGVNCIRIFPYSAIQFASYNVYKSALMPVGATELTTQERLAAGALAGVTSVVTTYPLDITRTRLSVQSAHISAQKLVDGDKLPGMWQAMKDIYVKEGGLLALYRGVWPTVLGVAPYVGLNFAVYEGSRAYLTPPGQEPSQLTKLACGALSGAVAQTVTYPADVLRRRFQVNTMKGVNYNYRGVFHALSVMYAEDGIRGFYLGLGPNLLKVIPAMGTSWVVYEAVMNYFKNRL